MQGYNDITRQTLKACLIYNSIVETFAVRRSDWQRQSAQRVLQISRPTNISTANWNYRKLGEIVIFQLLAQVSRSVNASYLFQLKHFVSRMAGARTTDTWTNKPRQNIPGQHIPDKIYPDKTYREKYTGQKVPGQNIPDNIYRTKYTWQNIPDKIYHQIYTRYILI